MTISTIGSARASVLIATPVKNATGHLQRYVENLRKLTYPHALLSLALLESDSEDGSFERLLEIQEALKGELRDVKVFKRDFGFRTALPRWATEIQRERRSVIAKSRNHLFQRALADEDWVLWLDVDLADYPADVLERLVEVEKDIVVPHCVGQDGHTFDLNTFKFTEGAAARDWSPFVHDGIVQPPKGEGRLYLEDLREHAIVSVDAVGGTMLLVRADLHREGLVFPTFSYKLYIETEGLAMMARDMGYLCWGLPHLVVTHT